MDILEDKVICQLIQSLKVRLRKKTISSREQPFLSAPRLIFVCGKEWVDSEETIRNYTIRTLRKCRIANHYGTQNEAVLCIIAEKLYVQDLSEDIFSLRRCWRKSVIVLSLWQKAREHFVNWVLL